METLPPEICLILLCQLDSIQSLFSLLGASPASFRVYHEYKHIVYPSVVENGIDPTLLEMARISNKIRHGGLESIHRTVPLYDGRSTRIVSLPLQPFNCASYDPTDSSRMSVDEAKQLYRFHALVSGFVQGATEQAMELFLESFHEPSLMTSRCPLQLSASEEYRVTRAFYRLEYITPICQRWMETRMSSVTYDPEITKKCLDPLRDLLKNLTFDELEELYFVYERLYYFLEQWLDLIEDDKIDQFVQERFAHVSCPLGLPSAHFDWDQDDSLEIFQHDTGRSVMEELKHTAPLAESLEVLYDALTASHPDERMTRLESLQHYSRNVWRSPTRWFSGWHGPARILSERVEHEMIDFKRRKRSGGFSNVAGIPVTNGNPTAAILNLLWAYHCSDFRCYNISFLHGLAASGMAIWDSNRIAEGSPKTLLDREDVC